MNISDSYDFKAVSQGLRKMEDEARALLRKVYP